LRGQGSFGRGVAILTTASTDGQESSTGQKLSIRNLATATVHDNAASLTDNDDSSADIPKYTRRRSTMVLENK